MKLIDRQDDSKLLNICHTTIFFSLNPQTGTGQVHCPADIHFIFIYGHRV
jgi:hypothetical protein